MDHERREGRCREERVVEREGETEQASADGEERVSE